MLTGNSIRYVSDFFLRKMQKKKKKEKIVYTTRSNGNLRIQLYVPRCTAYTLSPELSIHINYATVIAQL